MPRPEPYAYASLMQDGVEFMLLRRAEENQSAAGARRPEGIWDAYVRTRGVHVFCEAVRGRGAVRMALTKRAL